MCRRRTIRVATGSLWATRDRAALAISSSTPATSNSTVPGRTMATQWSGSPLPLPIRVSRGFLETGLSGKMRM